MPNVIDIPTLGDQVKSDRGVRLTQEELAERLQQVVASAADPIAEGWSPEVNWVVNLENNRLRRSTPDAVRDLLAKILGGDKELYRALPMQPTEHARRAAGLPPGHDPYAVARLLLHETPPESQILFDYPENGPLSARYPQALELVFRIIAQRQSNVILYSNERPESQLAETMHCLANLLLVAALLQAKRPFSGAPDEPDVQKYLGVFSINDIVSSCEQAIALRTRRDDATRHCLTKGVAHHLIGRVAVFERSEAPPAGDRINPLTVVLLKFARQTEQGQTVALCIDEHRYCRKIEDRVRVEQYFEDRADKGIVRRKQISVRDVLKWAEKRQTPIDLEKP